MLRRDSPSVRAAGAEEDRLSLGLEEFIRVTLGRVGEKLVAVPLARGAGVITTYGACRRFDAHPKSG
jgi:putative molybdopterin biosynthesis protein